MCYFYSFITTVILFFSSVVKAETLIISPFESPKYSGVISKKALTLSGEIKTVPMGGATVLLATPSMGQIIIGKYLSLPSDIAQRLTDFEKNKTSVTVTGSVVTICSDKEIEQGTVGCRMFDTTKPISVKVY